jgi:hypothetical protein
VKEYHVLKNQLVEKPIFRFVPCYSLALVSIDDYHVEVGDLHWDTPKRYIFSYGGSSSTGLLKRIEAGIGYKGED